MHTQDTGPTETIQMAPMRTRQWMIIILCILLMALDGYDILSIAFAAPGITAQWGLSKSVLGLVLSLELVGMAVGFILMGPWTDRNGRRPAILYGLGSLTIGMLIAGLAPNVYVLGAARLFTGVGIGWIGTAAAATGTEFCNNKSRALVVTLIAGGFPLGAYIGAAFLGPLLMQYDWRITFYLGSALGLVLLPFFYFLVPETISFLNRARPQGALQRIQTIMSQLGHQAPDQLTSNAPEEVVHVGVKSLFNASLFWTTALLTIAYFGNIMTYYYFAKWMPIIVTDLGYTASQATQVLGMISLGGVVGSIGIAVAARLVSINILMTVSLVAAAFGVSLFPQFTDSLLDMKTAGFVSGVFILASNCGFWGLMSVTYPSSVLASGSGMVAGIGRGGAVLGPILPGLLFAAGMSVTNIAITMAAGSFVGGLAVFGLMARAQRTPGPPVRA